MKYNGSSVNTHQDTKNNKLCKLKPNTTLSVPNPHPHNTFTTCTTHDTSKISLSTINDKEMLLGTESVSSFIESRIPIISIPPKNINTAQRGVALEYPIDQIQMENQSSLNKNIINKIIHFLKNNYCEKISLANLADLTGISSSHLNREFKKATGLTPHQYLEKIRFDKATELLTYSQRSLTEIALEIGYSHTRFSTLFKARIGISPREYRRRYQHAAV